MSARTWLVGVWLVLGPTLAACTWSSDRSAALNGAAGQDASGAGGASGTGGAAAGAGAAGADGGMDTMPAIDTAPPNDGPTDAPVEKCTPITLCQTAGGNYCGSFPDGCGGLVNCGNDCPQGQTCGGGGTAHLCGGDPSCKPITCSGTGYQFCGTIGDGCNHALKCPDCTAPATCGGSGHANVCGM